MDLFAAGKNVRCIYRVLLYIRFANVYRRIYSLFFSSDFQTKVCGIKKCQIAKKLCTHHRNDML